MAGELLNVIARVRRAMPRNADVMTVCSELEQRLVVRSPGKKFDRRAYQRDYMRRRRAAEKGVK